MSRDRMTKLFDALCMALGVATLLYVGWLALQHPSF
jgi:hypothetical protein